MDTGSRSRLLIAMFTFLVIAAVAMAGIAIFQRATPYAPVGPERYAGWTRVATTTRYVMVINVLPAEVMFTRAAYERVHPTQGELVLDGHPTPVGASMRHTEAHIYSKKTGLPLAGKRPRITLVDHAAGGMRDVDATKMQDVVIGATDMHFGSNISIPSGHEFTITVALDGEEVSVDGNLT